MLGGPIHYRKRYLNYCSRYLIILFFTLSNTLLLSSFIALLKVKWLSIFSKYLNEKTTVIVIYFYGMVDILYFFISETEFR